MVSWSAELLGLGSEGVTVQGAVNAIRASAVVLRRRLRHREVLQDPRWRRRAGIGRSLLVCQDEITTNNCCAIA